MDLSGQAPVESYERNAWNAHIATILQCCPPEHAICCGRLVHTITRKEGQKGKERNVGSNKKAGECAKKGSITDNRSSKNHPI